MKIEMNALRAISIAAVALSISAIVTAHHSIAGQFDMKKTLHVTGVVSKVEWTNPHVYLFFDTKESDGTAVTWKLETLPVAMLRKAGIKKEMLVTGETVKMLIVPARDGTDHLGFILNITFPDGRQLQFSADPNGPVTNTK